MFIDDGFSTLVAFSLKPSIKFREKSVTPPGIQSGGATDTTTMRNAKWRTKSPKKLKELTDMSMSVTYDPDVYNDINEIIGVNQQITVTFPDAQTITFWGWLDVFTPGELTEGNQGTADVTVIPSNHDDSGNEVDPVNA